MTILSFVLFSDISQPVEHKGNFYTTEKASFGMMLSLCVTAILGAIVGYSATEEKVLVRASLLYNFSAWLFMLVIQYGRIVYNKGMFDGLILSIMAWSILFVVIHMVSAFFLSKIDRKRREREEEDRWKENIKKVGIQYVYTFDDGSEITVTQEDMLLDEKKSE
ncbi:hypothetical protein DFQ00_102453 [Paenibacillus barcinonensis]|uniref:Uncharacterized protein n=1 Tax=Paenibacillus barcinonensis TaxID=198119 RepID=A0A2V4VDW9_PAEBA|nr:hypothetical protein DFQ00_102453 [Paenibacillus barcinonensis]